MHNTLAGLPSVALLDTNVLLDAAFVVNGAARLAVRLLPQLGYETAIDWGIQREAHGILERYAVELGLTFDPSPVLADFISSAGIRVLPEAPRSAQPRVNRADRHVAASARHYGAWILTGDTPLVVECQNAGISARLPWDVIMGHATAAGSPPEIDHIIRVVRPEQRSGMIFGRVIAGGWAGMSGIGRFTVCDLAGVARLYYDSNSSAWVFELPQLAVAARVRCMIAGKERWAVCGDYLLPGAGQRGRVSIRAGLFPDQRWHAHSHSLRRLSSPIEGTATFGHTVQNSEHWNGYLRTVVVGPQTMNSKTWNAIVAIPEGAPNPYDANQLANVLRTTEMLSRSASGLLLPSEQDLRQFS